MATPIETAILKLRGLGFFQFLLPFMLTAAIFYGLLRKSQIFGDPDRNVAVNAVVSLSAAFMVWAYPIIAGVDIETQLVSFFMTGAITLLIGIIGILVAGMVFPPDLPKVLSEKFKTGGFWGIVLVAGILVGLIVVIASGLFSVFFPTGMLGNVGGKSILSEDVIVTIIMLAFLFGMIFLIVWGGGKQ